MKQVSNFPTIIIDGVFFQFGQSGITQVWLSLLKEWVKTGFAKHLVILDRNETAPKLPNINYYQIDAYAYYQTVEDSQKIQDICGQLGANLFISSYYTTPLSTPSVFMVYDMIPEVMGDALSKIDWKEKHYGILHASHYLSISHHTAKDLREIFTHIKPEQITVAHCGIKPIFSPANSTELQAFKEKYNLKKPYFLLVGERVGVNNYKNASYVFQAISQIQDPDFDIICVGGKPTLESDLAALAKDITIHCLSLDDQDLKVAYSGAIAYINPSRYEGFGLPILEAMACGCPVITGYHSSIPEVAGKAAYYVDLDHEATLVEAMYRVQTLPLRSQLIELGSKQIQQFSWSKMAKIVADTLLNVAKNCQSRGVKGFSPVNKELFQSLSLKSLDPQSIQQVYQKIANDQILMAKRYYIDGQLSSKREDNYQLLCQNQKKEIARLTQELEAMKTSKFWQIRNLWFQVKKGLGLPTD
ncbi:MAG: glycosyltransferase family 4 protein [Microcystaceae cyanobacterium]